MLPTSPPPCASPAGAAFGFVPAPPRVLAPLIGRIPAAAAAVASDAFGDYGDDGDARRMGGGGYAACCNGRRRRRPRRASLALVLSVSAASSSSSDFGGDGGPAARVAGPPPASEAEAFDLLEALRAAGFGTVEFETTYLGDEGSVDGIGDGAHYFRYVHSKATGMLKLVGVVDESDDASPVADGFEAPRWVPVVRGEENVLVANGWSFLDPDESEANSAFDVDAANAEGLYRPKWGQTVNNMDEDEGNDIGALGLPRLSSLGYNIEPMSREDVLAEADGPALSEPARSVLLYGGTDPPNVKATNDGRTDFSGRAGQDDVPCGAFVCALGGLPLFSTADLSPATASSGWLSFSRPVAEDHVALIQPDADADDRRVEVVCARSRCHLGHYFGRGEGYCINASALNFLPSVEGTNTADSMQISAPPDPSGKSRPVSWRPLTDPDPELLSPSERTLLDAMLPHASPYLRSVVLGAGCFWHVESALRRLPGVVTTQTGYAGGTVPDPTYEMVCGKSTTSSTSTSSSGSTGHAEVVLVTFDPTILPSRILLDCFLSMHDPTKVRAHGKHAAGTGQYRSCVYFDDVEMEGVAREAIEECRAQLGRELSTEVRLFEAGPTMRWFWPAEDRHQRHDEKVRGGRRGEGMGSEEVRTTSTLSVREWLSEYGRRNASVWGSGETVRVATTTTLSNSEPGDDGMAMMMI